MPFYGNTTIEANSFIGEQTYSRFADVFAAPTAATKEPKREAKMLWTAGLQTWCLVKNPTGKNRRQRRSQVTFGNLFLFLCTKKRSTHAQRLAFSPSGVEIALP